MSTGIEGRIDGVSELLSSLGELGSFARDAIVGELQNACLMVHGAAVKSIQAHESVDHMETRYKPKREVEVSSEGNAPNSDRGKLAQSVAFDVNEDTLVGTVGTNLEYGLFLELGTTQMRARPWLFPAFEGSKAEILKGLGQSIQFALRSRSA